MTLGLDPVAWRFSGGLPGGPSMARGAQRMHENTKKGVQWFFMMIRWLPEFDRLP